MVSKADREFWIEYFVEGLVEQEHKVMREHVDDARALKSAAVDNVADTKLGKTHANYQSIMDHAQRLRRASDTVLNEADESSYTLPRKYAAAIENEHQALLEEQEWYPSKLHAKRKAVRAQIMLATTDTKLADVVRGLMKLLGVSNPEEVLDAE